MSGLIYKPIKGLPSNGNFRYRASNEGNIEYFNPNKGEWIEKARIFRGDRPTVEITVLGKPKKFSVGHLVLEAFGKPKPPGARVHWRNGDKRDSSLSNLEWNAIKKSPRLKTPRPKSRAPRPSRATKVPRSKVWVIREPITPNYKQFDGRLDAARLAFVEYTDAITSISRIRGKINKFKIVVAGKVILAASLCEAIDMAGAMLGDQIRPIGPVRFKAYVRRFRSQV